MRARAHSTPIGTQGYTAPGDERESFSMVPDMPVAPGVRGRQQGISFRLDAPARDAGAKAGFGASVREAGNDAPHGSTQ